MLVSVTNHSERKLSGVKAAFGDDIGWEGVLDPGESEWIFGFPKDETAARLSFELGGREHTQECGYPVIIRADFVEMTIGPDGSVGCKGDIY